VAIALIQFGLAFAPTIWWFKRRTLFGPKDSSWPISACKVLTSWSLSTDGAAACTQDESRAAPCCGIQNSFQRRRLGMYLDK